MPVSIRKKRTKHTLKISHISEISFVYRMTRKWKGVIGLFTLQWRKTNLSLIAFFSLYFFWIRARLRKLRETLKIESWRYKTKTQQTRFSETKTPSELAGWFSTFAQTERSLQGRYTGSLQRSSTACYCSLTGCWAHKRLGSWCCRISLCPEVRGGKDYLGSSSRYHPGIEKYFVRNALRYR